MEFLLYRMRVAKRSDTRISVMNELIQGIQVIKVRMFLNVLIFAVLKLFLSFPDVRVGNTLQKCCERSTQEGSGSNTMGLVYSRNLLVDNGFYWALNTFHRNFGVHLRRKTHYRRPRVLDGNILQRSSINSCNFLSARSFSRCRSIGT